jgi:hypothetical protein
VTRCEKCGRFARAVRKAAGPVARAGGSVLITVCAVCGPSAVTPPAAASVARVPVGTIVRWAGPFGFTTAEALGFASLNDKHTHEEYDADDLPGDELVTAGSVSATPERLAALLGAVLVA